MIKIQGDKKLLDLNNDKIENINTLNTTTQEIETP